jgi:hypothetical protein
MSHQKPTEKNSVSMMGKHDKNHRRKSWENSHKPSVSAIFPLTGNVKNGTIFSCVQGMGRKKTAMGTQLWRRKTLR